MSDDGSIDDKPALSRYDLRKLPVCPSCAALQGQDYKRQIPESAARAIRRGAA